MEKKKNRLDWPPPYPQESKLMKAWLAFLFLGSIIVLILMAIAIFQTPLNPTG